MYKKGDWTCPQCAYDNFASRTTCKNCGCYKSKATMHTPHAKPGDWICPNDNELNFASRKDCRKCGTKKLKISQSQQPQQPYQEAQQQQQEAQQQQESQQIQSPQQESQQTQLKIRPGDWYCIEDSCKTLNFATRTFCFGCGKPKNNVLETKNEEKDETCIICFERETDTVITKCGHLGYCNLCALKMKECPICRLPYDSSKDILKIFRVI